MNNLASRGFMHDLSPVRRSLRQTGRLEGGTGTIFSTAPLGSSKRRSRFTRKEIYSSNSNSSSSSVLHSALVGIAARWREEPLVVHS